MTIWVRIAAGAGLAGVAFGAFGAHAVEGRLTADAFGAYETGVLYHLVHAIALLALALNYDKAPKAIGRASAFLFAGVVLFSGSLYALALTGITPLAYVTPFGGVSFLIGWGVLVTSKLKV